MTDRLTTTLQESVLTLLATNDEQGRIAAGILRPEFFDDNYRDVATRVLDFRRKEGKAPGKAHLDDLLDDVLSNPKHKRRQQYIHILEGVYAQAEGLNAAYVFSRVSEFARLQSLKAAWFEAADILKAGGEGSAAEVEEIWLRALRGREAGMTAGVFLSDRVNALSFLDRTDNAYKIGIPALDRVNCGPTPKEILLFIAPKGRGKSWWGVHCARQILLQGGKVAHVSLEMPIEQVVQRYYQNLFAIPKRGDEYRTTRFLLDDLGRIEDFKERRIKPKMYLRDPNVRKYLHGRIKDWGAQFDRLVVQEFPSGTLTEAKLEAYLDYLEVAHKFIPNALVLDYPDLMHIGNRNELRIELGRKFVNIRGICGRRNLAGILMTQGNRESIDAATVKSSMVAEDVSKLFTSDKVVLYSQTDAEREMGLARLRVNNNRGDRDSFNVLISQSYTSGQFVLDSLDMGNQRHYWDLVGPKKERSNEGDGA